MVLSWRDRSPFSLLTSQDPESWQRIVGGWSLGRLFCICWRQRSRFLTWRVKKIILLGLGGIVILCEFQKRPHTFNETWKLNKEASQCVKISVIKLGKLLVVLTFNIHNVEKLLKLCCGTKQSWTICVCHTGIVSSNASTETNFRKPNFLLILVS